jgi:hypothetical protein
MVTPINPGGSGRWVRIGLAAATAAVLSIGATVPALAVIDGDCTGHGYSTPASAGKPTDVAASRTGSASGGTSVDFKAQSTWEVPSYHDYVAGEGESTNGSMGSGFADVVFYGFTFPLVGGDGHGTSGKGGPLSAADLNLGPLKGKPVAAYLVAYGVSTPDSNPPPGVTAAPRGCSGHIIIHFADVKPTDSIVGEVGIILVVIGGVGVLVVSIRRTA